MRGGWYRERGKWLRVVYPIKKPYHWVSSTVPQPVEEGVKDMRISENGVGSLKTAPLSRTTVYDLVNISCVLGYEYNFQWRGDRLLPLRE